MPRAEKRATSVQPNLGCASPPTAILLCLTTPSARAWFASAHLSEELDALDREIEILEKQAEVHVVTADEASLAAFGSNVLDPATREPSARAGRAQAAATLEAARAFWG